MRRENLDIDKYHSGGAGMAYSKDWTHSKMECLAQIAQSSPVRTGLTCSRPRTKLGASFIFPRSTSTKLVVGLGQFELIIGSHQSTLFPNQKLNLIFLLVIGIRKVTRYHFTIFWRLIIFIDPSLYKFFF